ncbi:MAG: LamG domain-containing protein [Lentisphaeria bacterium]|nr:LamG domain-containing protein [Lentisphaeria bacterium]
MKSLQLAVMSAAVLTAGSLFAQDLKALEEHVTFQISFEGSVEVDRAEGEIKLQQGKHEDVQSGYSYVEGVKGKALYNTDPRGHVRRYLMKDNINFDLPGTVSLWVKPVAWKKLTPDSPKQKNGRYNTITTPFFMTGWCRTGYIVLERACPEFLNRPEQVRLLFPAFKNIRSYYSKEFKWEDNKWYHIVMTWSGYNYTVYINGEVVLAAAHKEKLKQSDMHKNFEVRPNPGMTLDEFTIYNKALTPAEIKALYNSMKK